MEKITNILNKHLEPIIWISGAILSLSALICILNYNSRTEKRAIGDNTKLVSQLYSKIAGDDRMISKQETRGFLDKIGYIESINEDDKLYIKANPYGANLILDSKVVKQIDTKTLESLARN